MPEISSSTEDILLAEIKNLRSEIEELKREKDDLEILLETTTEHADMVESELLESKETAEVANKAKSEFIASISHEFRTPLTGIIGYAQVLLEEGDLSEEQKDDINKIYKCGNHLLTLINDILDIAKIEASKLEIYYNEFHLPNFLRNIIDLFELGTRQKNITFTYQALSPLPMVMESDEKRLRQILINLISNAIKFTNKGGVVFKVGYATSSEKWEDSQKTETASNSPVILYQKPHLRFQIEDTGIGIPSDQLESIFLPFHQVEDFRYQGQGTGLGLAISQKLAGMLGSTLKVDSKEGKGSIFWLDVAISPEFQRFNDL